MVGSINSKPKEPLRQPYPADLRALTSFRFPLALGVVFYHLRMAWPGETYDLTGLIERSRLNVDLFFILSGFILTHVYWRQVATRRYRHVDFVAARVARIFPLHILLMLVLGGLALAASGLGAEFDQSRFRPADFLQSLLLLQSWFPTSADEMRWNGPSWSLSAEWFAYLLFPVYAWIGLKLRRRPIVLIALAFTFFLALDLAYQQLFGQILTHAWLNLGVLRIAPEFLYGVGLYFLGEKISAGRTTAVAAATSSFGTLLVLMLYSADDRLIVAAAGPLILSLALLAKAGCEGPLARPWAVAAGEASYALYLVHWPMIVAWKGVADRLGGRLGEQMVGPVGLGVLLSLAVVASVGLHYCWERPARLWVRARVGPPPARVPAPAKARS